VCVNLQFLFLNFVHQPGTETRFENPSRHKRKRWQQGVLDGVTTDKKNDKNDQVHIDHFDISLFDNSVLTDNQA
jgi:hypothetical protein